MKAPVAFLCLLLAPLPVLAAPASESICFGSPGKGRIEAAWRLPLYGPNFGAYSTLGWLLGRTYVHSRAYRVILQAYAALEQAEPETHYTYAETGPREGGKFWPHVTHQNGLSVDFMVPVLDEAGRPAEFPKTLWNRFGYDVEFDAQGRWQEYRIDFEAMAEHLYQLQRAAQQEGIGIRLVIFAPELTQSLLRTRRGPTLAKRLRFLRRPARLRHDEHYHVDFAVPCKK